MDLAESAELSLTSSALQLLQSDLTQPQLVIHLENYYLHGLVLYGAMWMCQRAITYVVSRNMRADVLAWIMSIFKRTATGPWHYTQTTTACGPSFQHMLREVFFSIIRHVLEYVAAARNGEERRTVVVPDADDVIGQDDVLVLFGPNQRLRQLERDMTR